MIVRAVDETNSGCPFRAWKLYLQHDEYSEKDAATKKVRAAQAFLLKRGPPAGMDPEGERDALYVERRFSVDLEAVRRDEELLGAWGDFENNLNQCAEKVWAIFGLAKHQNVLDAVKKKLQGEAEECG